MEYLGATSTVRNLHSAECTYEKTVFELEAGTSEKSVMGAKKVDSGGRGGGVTDSLFALVV